MNQEDVKYETKSGRNSIQEQISIRINHPPQRMEIKINEYEYKSYAEKSKSKSNNLHIRSPWAGCTWLLVLVKHKGRKSSNEEQMEHTPPMHMWAL